MPSENGEPTDDTTPLGGPAPGLDGDVDTALLDDTTSLGGPAPGLEGDADTALLDELADDTAAEKASSSRVQGWGRIFRGNKLLWVMAGVAVLCLVAGLLAGRFILSPADSAANAEVDKPGLVTAPVEFGALSNDVTIRADVGYTDPVEVKLDTSSISGPAIVTGQVPKSGATLKPLSVALEIGGRPVIVLPGELPAYRTLRMGVSGPDVLQLKEALKGLGIPVGDVKSNLFDQALADAIAKLYAQAGYPTPPSEEGTADAYRAAQDSLDAANDNVTSAEAALAAVNAGPTHAEIVAADGAVNVAQTALNEAKSTNAGATAIAQAQADLNNAIANRNALWDAKDTTNEQNAVNAAYDQVNRATEDLELARQRIQPHLPSSEVLYLKELPRRVDAVNVSRGQMVDGVALTVSGATVAITGSAAEVDAKLLKVGDEGTFDLADGTPHTAKIVKITPGKDGDRWSIDLEPAELTGEQIQALQGSNVRVKISVGATEGDVLSVPLAALTAGPGGESRVEVVESDPREGENAKTRIVDVDLGLSAGGVVEVRPKDGEKLEEGDLVVIGE